MNETPAPASYTQPPKSPWYTNKKLIALVIAAVIIGSAAIAWVILGKNSPAQTSSSPTTTQAATENSQKPLAPYSIAYAVSSDIAGQSGACPNSRTQLYWRPVTGGDKTSAASLGDGNSVSYYGLYKNKIFVVADAGCGSKDGPAVWLSTDAGQSYSKVYSGKAAASESAMGEQVTSATFSSDGKTIVIASLSNDFTKNTIKEIDTDTKSTKDLFSLSSAGVFIQGYDRTVQRMYYYTGCYNCDGNTNSKLLVRDIAKNSDTTLAEDAGHITESTVPNADFSKFLLVKSTPGTNALGGGKPYTLEELDVASKTIKTLMTVTDDAYIKAGYRDSDGTVYYSKGNTVSILDAAGKSSVVFESSKAIVDTYYASKDLIVASSGDYSNYSLTNFTLSANKAVTVLSGDSNTRVLGVGWK